MKSDVPIAGASRVGAIILAAGTSSRLGTPKQLLDFRGVPLVVHCIAQSLASRLAYVSVVVGNRAEEVRSALVETSVEIVDNPNFAQGQSTSLRAGLIAFPRDLAAAMILLVDQPFVDTVLIDRLLALYQESGALIVAPQFSGRRGNPVIFDRSLFSELLTVVGDTGARDIISRHRDRLVALELADDRSFLDVDTWEDYRQVSEKTSN